MLRLKWIMSVAGLAACIVIGVFISARLQPGPAQASGVSEAEAVALAVKYAQALSPGGQLTSPPTQINAKRMTLGAAVEMEEGRPPDPATAEGRQSQQLVWLVFLRGHIVENVEPAPGLPVPAPIVHNQEGVIVDATTGELRSISMYPTTHEVAAASSLPQVQLSPQWRAITVPRIAAPAVTAAPPPTPLIPRPTAAGGVLAAPSEATATPAR